MIRRKLRGFAEFNEAINSQQYEMKALAERIYKFLDEYAGIRPDWDSDYDDDDDKFTSPDASMMKYSADMLNKGERPESCWSSWDSGGYVPYTSEDGRKEHDSLKKEIYKYISMK